MLSAVSLKDLVALDKMLKAVQALEASMLLSGECQ